jgi:lipoprotein-anchoring transpeptidase ErfK/SrfK
MSNTANRRLFILGGASLATTGVLAPLTISAETQAAGFQVEPRYRPQIVRIAENVSAGEIHVDSAFRFLYLTLPDARAVRYGVAVGEETQAFDGEAVIDRKAKWPKWTPTSSMLERDPVAYGPYKNGMPGGPRNPLGARALYLYKDGRDTLYRIHGTPEPWSIGRAVSSGCIRMVNEHVTDLYERVPVGTRVVVYPA